MVGVGVQLPFHFFLWQIVNMTHRLKYEKNSTLVESNVIVLGAVLGLPFSVNSGEAGKTENQRSFNWNQKSCMNFIRIKTEVTIHPSTSVTARTEIHWILAKTRTLMWSFKDRYLTRVRRLSSGGRSGSGVGRFYLMLCLVPKFFSTIAITLNLRIYAWSIKYSRKNNILHSLTVNDETNLLNLINL